MSSSKAEGGTLETLKVVAQALVIALVIRTVLFQPFSIPSGSLIPTLLIGDYLFVSKYSYGYSKYSIPFSPNIFEGRLLGAAPKRGDIAVFRNLKSEHGDDYIKRVIGLPGDKIQMSEGKLFINGAPVPRKPAGEYLTTDAYGSAIKVPMYVETLPEGKSYHVIEREGDKAFWDNTLVYEVPQGHYFMMGDNRDNSTDSRDLKSVGYVPYDAFIGRAEMTFFSFAPSAHPFWEAWRWVDRVRLERLFQPIH